MDNRSHSEFRKYRSVGCDKLLCWAFCFVVTVVVGCSKRPAAIASLPRQSPLVTLLKTQCGMATAVQTETNSVVKLKGLDLFKASDAALHTLGDAQEIEELEIVASDLRTPAFGEIGRLTGLKKLTLLNCQFLPEQLLTLQNLTNLETLELMFTVGEETSENMAKMLGKLSPDEEQTAEALKRKGFREEIVQMALLTDRSMPCFDKLTRLKRLELVNTYFSAAGLQHLKFLTNLEEANIGPIGLTEETATPFLAMTKLRSLKYFNVDDGVVNVLSKISSLEDLDLWSGDVTDVSASKLAKLKKLQHLQIRGNKMTDQGLQHLKELSSLNDLDLGYAKNITANGLAEFAKSRPTVVISH